MELKVFLIIILLTLTKLVNANLNLQLVNTALDQNLYEEVLDDEECRRQIILIRSFTLLAMQFADAGIRIPRGLLNGNSIDLGNYHQCLGINLNVGDMDIQGKYCAIRVPMNQTFQLPATESLWDLSVLNSLNISEEVKNKYDDYDIARSQLNSLVGLSGEDHASIGFQYTDDFCRLPDDKPWVPADYVAIAVFLLIGILTVFSTIYDLFNTFVIKEVVSKKALWITSATISVDTFFTLGGILLVYTTAVKMKSASLLKNLHLFYLNRILRMLPLLSTAVLLQASYFNRMSDGPFWTTVSRQTNVCRTYWWSTLLHLQNLLNPGNMCIPHSWYIAIDVHLYFVSPVVLYWVLSGKKRSAWLALIFGLLVPMTAAGIYNYIQNFPAGTIVLSRPGADMARFMNYYYFNTLTRAAPFFVGMIFGYILHINRCKKVYIPWPVVILLWICTLSMTTLIFFSTYFIKQLDWDNELVDNLMNTFMRPTWGACLGWIVFACVHGYGGPANWLLTLDIWKLPARISYAMFIFHYPIMFVYYDSMISTSYFSVARITFISLAHLTLTLIVSYILTILIDSPFSLIFKILLDKKRFVHQSAAIDKQNILEETGQENIKNTSINEPEEFNGNLKEANASN